MFKINLIICIVRLRVASLRDKLFKKLAPCFSQTAPVRTETLEYRIIRRLCFPYGITFL